MGNSITQKLKYKQSVIKFSYKYGVTKAAIKFQENKRTIYRWRERYDGTLESLKDRSRRPHHHPKEHTKEEIKLIKNYKANNKKTGLVILWIKLKKAGYTRSVTSLYRMLIKLEIYNKTPSKKKEKNSGYYEQMTYPGEKVQIKVFPLKIERVQTDNGFEFTNRLSWNAFEKEKKTMFENKLEEYGIEQNIG